jgi:hypothetical protein
LANKTFIGAIALFAVAIGFLSFANAEEGIFADVDPKCFEQYNTTVATSNGTYTKHQLLCHWEVNEFVQVGAIQANLTDAEQEALDDAKEDRESGNVPEIDLTYLETPSSIPETITDVVPESCLRNNPSPGDIEECNLDSKRSFCERGIQSTSPIQQYEYFNVSEYIPRDDLQIELGKQTPLSSKLKAYEECRAELKLILDLNQTHYVGISKEVAKGEYNPYHRDFVTTDLTFPSRIQDNDKLLISQEWIAQNKICTMPYGDKYLKDLGCEFEYEGYYKNNTGITEYEARLLNTGPLAEYYKYHETDGVGYLPTWLKKHSFGITGINTSQDNTQWQFKATLED